MKLNDIDTNLDRIVKRKYIYTQLEKEKRTKKNIFIW